ncbi:hypothetical protein LTR99_003343 [Exophiala xenobiotica]|uniref:HhH-GPD domain-containing protein n=1 Tax=Vermiconidia calcicola TaxID=1690605 RepID=A0AAV9QDU5_9PEZI|nr:hypothetical protein H2202_006180 [Exophiala xenobiotica]KAK5539010.1 hypothetical protein LTR25_004554 [Vermiconidia calcicola]KAK5547248.1 hypothetical protein LTR23_002887 [Chaetothyriales sp. CCFEE 6169]KAK5190739.1 hypothetical protein LTR92_009392 [Exophiala xenobiotica]KAK5217951.1 hypothetical protein LTR72_009122 [Exophiala xenobiotica]
MSEIPPPSTITTETFQIALNCYPSIVEKVYKSKIKDAKKVSEAIERDRWRFEELPTTVAQVKSPGSTKVTTGKGKIDVRERGLTKEAIERLVQWKITHGHSRPFLPAMVRKNEPSAVEAQTALALEKLLATSDLSKPTPTPTIVEALNAVCKLTGIGPATGTLILNIFDPVHIPFFQDEMYAWFFPDTKAEKLKYTQKEYLQLLGAVRPVLQRLNVKAIELEKVSYVLDHLDLLEEQDSKSIVYSSRDGSGQDAPKATEDVKVENTKEPQPEHTPSVKKGTKRGANIAADADEVQQPTKRQTRRKG